MIDMAPMVEMVNFSAAMLQALADFLGTPPILYLFGLVLLLFIAGLFKKIMP
ncbi:hypothetical protein CE91St41_27990 [Oscillospiraceae bacterium]|nr:hypothetical protein CE91St40_09550 [Oscillospiraceae bacterium]BDF75910.1 hypothetical protein CE91St41_27990 [Oscillospiraceae bacterium]